MWETVKLADVCKIQNGGTPKSNVKAYWNGDIEWLTPKDMGKLTSRYVSKTERQISADGLANSSAKIAPENSIILSCRAPIGHVAINTVPMTYNQGCKALIPSERILTHYLYYFLIASKQLLNDLGTGTTFKEISAKTLSKVTMSLPPLSEQVRIVAKLDAAFAEIDRVQQISNDQLTSLWALEMRVLGDIFAEVDGSFEKKRMGDCYDVRDGTHDSPKYVQEGYPLVTSKNLKAGELDLDNVKLISKEDYKQIKKRSKVDVGDILMAMIGTIGNPVVVNSEPNYAIKNVALFKVDQAKQDSNFINYYLRYITPKLHADAKGATQKFVGLGYLRDLLVPQPSLEHQRKTSERIAELISEIAKCTNILEEKFSQLNTLKSAILAQELRSEAA